LIASIAATHIPPVRRKIAVAYPENRPQGTDLSKSARANLGSCVAIATLKHLSG
jgi:hypothetical protein